MFKRNTAVTGFQIGHFIQTADGAAKTTGTPACKRLLDGTPGMLTNAASYDSTAGVWKIDLAAADTNGDMVGLSFTLADCLPIGYTLRTTTKLVSELNDYAGADTSGVTTLLARIIGTLATGTHNPQSGDAFVRLGAPAGASVSADVAAVKAETALIVEDTGTTLPAALTAIDDFIDTEVAAIKAKTDNLPSDPADQSAVEDAITAATSGLATAANLAVVDTVVDSILADTGTDGVVVAAGSKTGYALTSTEHTNIADAILKRDWTAVTGEASRSLLNSLRFLRNKWSVSGSTLTVTKEDDATTAWTATLNTDAAADPITGSDPA